MRICHVVEAAGGGSGQVVADLVAGCVAAGDDVTLVYSAVRMDDKFKSAIDGMRDKIALYEIPMRRAVGVWDFVSGYKLYRLLKRLPPFEIIHGHSSKAGALTRLAGIFLPGAVQVYTPHAFMSMAPGASRIYGWIERILCFLGEAIFTGSDNEMLHAIDMKMPKEKLHMVLNGIDTNFPDTRDYARKEMGWTGDEYIIGFVGRLVEQKNPGRLVEAFSLAAARRDDLRMAMVGEGELKPSIEKDVSQRGLSAKIHVMGRRDARKIMPGFDCLLCSSDYESYGLVLVEALAAGIPIVSTPVGIAASVAVGNTGIMTPDFSASSLADAVLKLAGKNMEEKRIMSLAAKAKAGEYTLDKMVTCTRGLYRELLDERRG